jgi:signal transduction histidine kinase
MNLRGRILGLIAGLVLLAMGLSLWRYIDLNDQLQVELTAQMVERDVASVRQLVQLANQNFRERLFEQITREQTGRHLGLSTSTEEELERTLASGPFLALALLKFDKESWAAAWSHQRQSLTGRWPQGYLKDVLLGLPVDGVTADNTVWFRVSDPGQQPIFLMLTQMKDGADTAIAVGFLPSGAFATVTDALKGSGSEVIVVDERGFAFGYGEQSYVGARLADSHPAVTETLKRREVLTSFSSQDRGRGQVHAAAAKIDGTNLYAVVTHDHATSWALVPRLAAIMIIFAIAFVLLGVGFGYWTIVPVEQALEYLAGQLDAVAHGRPVGHFPAGNPYLDPLKDSVERLIAKESGTAPAFIQEATASQVEAEKMGAYKEMSVGLAQALRDPLAAVLAQAQLARAKSGHDDLKDHFVVIERETRRARDTIEHLLRLTGEERFPRTRLDIQDVLLTTLAAQKGLLNSHNVRLVKEIAATAPISAHAGQLQTALEEIVKNAVEAMSQTGERQLKFTTSVNDANVRLTVEDTGAGVKQEVVGKVFDPFYTTKADKDHKGLGLTVAKGIIKSLGGRVVLESDGEGKGTRVIVEFPIVSARAKPEVTEAPKGDLQKPITGTSGDNLPAAPGIDEITMTGLKMADSPPQMADAEEVTVRSPKVKESGT